MKLAGENEEMLRGRLVRLLLLNLLREDLAEEH